MRKATCLSLWERCRAATERAGFYFQFYPSTAIWRNFQFYPSTAGAVPLPFQGRLNLAPLKGELSRSD